MPYIEIKTNITLTDDRKTDLKSALAAQLATAFPGKTENWLMIHMTDNSTMFFGGSDAPCMMVDIAIFGAQSTASYDKMTAAVCAYIEETCAIPADRVYVKYSEYDRWGWNGSNF